MTGREDLFSSRLIADAAKYVVTNRLSGVTHLQRRFHIGALKASRLLQVLEDHGIVGPREEGKARDVLVDRRQLDEVLASLPGGEPR